MTEPTIRVGLMTTKDPAAFRLSGTFLVNGTRRVGSGEYLALVERGGITLRDAFGNTVTSTGELRIVPEDMPPARFTLRGVTIGIQFHWERKEDQTFQGGLVLTSLDKTNLTVINEIPPELYLSSVISSEMSVTSPLELLKSHAIISRSWLLAQRESLSLGDSTQVEQGKETERITWEKRQSHHGFDVCADDHCQRYQGITRTISPDALKAVMATRGEVLQYEGRICDTRYSKCCGGMTENFESAWEEVPVPYLVGVVDHDRPPEGFAFPLNTEPKAERWITAEPPAYCNPKDETILEKILVDFDQPTKDFFRWQVEYSREELERLIAEKSGMDFGTLLNLVPVQRGVSGRLVRLRIEGTKRTLTVGKELEIRRLLSRTHLYSSAFIVRTERDGRGVPTRFQLKGAGWGHGVGLCQIGAAVMALRGKSHEEILAHYYRGATLGKVY